MWFFMFGVVVLCVALIDSRRATAFLIYLHHSDLGVMTDLFVGIYCFCTSRIISEPRAFVVIRRNGPFFCITWAKKFLREGFLDRVNVILKLTVS